jgi:hypothetical protein
MSAKINHPFMKQPQRHAVTRNQQAILDRDVAAFDAVCDPKRPGKPLKPPPLQLQPSVRSAAALALARDLRNGAL